MLPGRYGMTQVPVCAVRNFRETILGIRKKSLLGLSLLITRKQAPRGHLKWRLIDTSPTSDIPAAAEIETRSHFFAMPQHGAYIRIAPSSPPQVQVQSSSASTMTRRVGRLHDSRGVQFPAVLRIAGPKQTKRARGPVASTPLGTTILPPVTSGAIVRCYFAIAVTSLRALPV